MTDKELRRLRRTDLIEIIYELQKSEARLQAENETLQKQLAEKQRRMEKAGSLAELAAAMNGLFEAAQATADQYLEGIRQAAQELAERREKPPEPAEPAEDAEDAQKADEPGGAAQDAAEDAGNGAGQNP